MTAAVNGVVELVIAQFQLENVVISLFWRYITDNLVKFQLKKDN